MAANEFDYRKYWQDIYAHNGTSGAGSYGQLAEFKGKVVNDVIEKYSVDTTIEFGCGDGNQIRYMNYKNYLGFDIAPSSVDRCIKMYQNDPSKKFGYYDPQTFNTKDFKADMVVCLDVLYHIINDSDYWKTLNCIFECAEKVVVLYTIMLRENRTTSCPSIIVRNIFDDVEKFTDFRVVNIVKQQLGSAADFMILERVNE